MYALHIFIHMYQKNFKCALKHTLNFYSILYKIHLYMQKRH